MEAQDCIDDYTNRIVDAIRNGDKQALRMALSQPVPTENDLFKARDLSALKLEYIAYLSLYAYAASKGGVSTEDVYLISNEYFNAGQLSKSQYFILLQKLAARFTDITSGMRENSGHSGHSFYFRRVAEYVLNHMSEPITVDSLAHQFGVNRSYLSTIFKKECGESPAVYIKRKKIEEACRILRSSDKSISKISLALGFSSQSHFTRVFREQTGKTPLKYRKEI